jgi:hypothetical protein
VIELLFMANIYKEYQTFAALYEEATEGWVWIAGEGLEPHRLLQLINKDNGKKVICECRVLDKNFIQHYNSKEQTRKIDEAGRGDVLVINDWYRSALGISYSGTTANLQILQLQNPIWHALRAGSQHPNPSVRVGNRLGVLGLLLGFGGFIIPIVQEPCKNGAWIGLSLVALVIIGLLACKGVKR